MREHEHDNLSDSLPELLADSLTDRVGPAPRAGPLPAALRGRLHARRRARRARVAGGVAGVIGAVLLAVTLLARFGPPAAGPTGPTPPNDVIVHHDPPTNPDQSRMAADPEPLRFDDPMFAAMDRAARAQPVSRRWSIGSYLRGDLPSEL
ncbi:MAG: hypothetical protein ACI89L_002665 [Phycisphaerales bacterium]|jgi:hypothetical protein